MPGEQGFWIPLALVPVAVLFLQFPFSRPVWNLLPELRFLQFPWRWLLALEAPMGIFFAAAVWPGDAARLWKRVAVVAGCTAVFLAMTACAGRVFFQDCDDEDAVAGMLDTYHAGQGFIGWEEYEPIGADNALVATGLPFGCLVSDPGTKLGVASGTPDEPPSWDASQGSCGTTYSAHKNGPEHFEMAATTPHAGFLILRLRSYPAWRVTVNGRAVAEPPQREDGLMAVPVPQGYVKLDVDWTTTTDMLAGRWMSAFGLLLLAGVWGLERRLRRTHL